MKRQIAALASCLLSLTCLASEVRYFNEDQVPTAAEVASLLAAPASVNAAPSGHGGRTRGIRLLDTEAGPHRVIAPVQQAYAPRRQISEPTLQQPLQLAKVSSVGSVALALRFGIDAAQLHPLQVAQLDALAEGIRQLPGHALITIAGHTDAFGSTAHNLDLSLRRALAVRAYLIRVHGIPGKRLVAVGKGETEPLARTSPFAPENRRVQVSAEYDLA